MARTRWSRDKNIVADTLQLNALKVKPGNILNGSIKIYLKTDGKLYIEDSNGVEYEIQLKKVKPPKK